MLSLRNLKKLVYLNLSIFLIIILVLRTYGSAIWRSSLAYVKQDLEKYNHKFLRYTANRIGKPLSPISHDYSEIHKLLGISNIESSMER